MRLSVANTYSATQEVVRVGFFGDSGSGKTSIQQSMIRALLNLSDYDQRWRIGAVGGRTAHHNTITTDFGPRICPPSTDGAVCPFVFYDSPGFNYLKRAERAYLPYFVAGVKPTQGIVIRQYIHADATRWVSELNKPSELPLDPSHKLDFAVLVINGPSLMREGPFWYSRAEFFPDIFDHYKHLISLFQSLTGRHPFVLINKIDLARNLPRAKIAQYFTDLGLPLSNIEFTESYNISMENLTPKPRSPDIEEPFLRVASMMIAQKTSAPHLTGLLKRATLEELRAVEKSIMEADDADDLKPVALKPY